MSDTGAPNPLALHVLPVLHLSGAERIAAELARRLPAHGFETRVLCLEDERAAIGVELAEAGIPVAGLRLSRRRTLACARSIARHVMEIAGSNHSPGRSSKIGRSLILHAHLFHANIATRLAFARLPRDLQRCARVISTVQVVERRFRPWHFWFDRWTARWCHLQVCVSEDVRRFQQAKTGLPASFFRVIENAVDVNRFALRIRPEGAPEHSPGQPWVRRTDETGGPETATESATALPEATTRVLAVGRLDPQKDYKALLRAWKLVSTQRPEAKLTIAGEGPERARLESLARSLALQNLEFAGFVSDIPALLASADLFVQSSLWEGLPLSVIEAMAAALPIVATDAEGTRNVIDQQRTGLLVPRSDPRALAEAILRLINDPALAARLAAAARDDAVERFSVEAMVAKYAALYREVLALRSD